MEFTSKNRIVDQSFRQDIGSNLIAALKSTGRIYYAGNTVLDSYPDEEKLEAFNRIKEWSDLVLTYQTRNVGYTSSKGLFRYYMSELGLRAHDEFGSDVQDGDIIEVYSTKGKRLFFHPELFDYSSYDPMDLFSTRWWELYRREPEITRYLMDCMRMIFFEEITKPFKPAVEKHIVSESSSPRKCAIEIEMLSVAPVYMGTAVAAVASHSRFRLL